MRIETKKHVYELNKLETQLFIEAVKSIEKTPVFRHFCINSNCDKCEELRLCRLIIDLDYNEQV